MTIPAIAAFADALTAAINTALNPTPAARRTYVASLDRLTSSALSIIVAPAELDDSPDVQGQAREDFAILVAVVQSVPLNNGEPDVPATDALVLLCEQIRDVARLADIGNCSWLKTEVPVLFSPSDMVTKQQFTAVLKFTFRSWRPRGTP